MICPQCDAVMNHHADKIDYAAVDQEVDSDFEGVVLQIHQCPQCPMVATQPQIDWGFVSDEWPLQSSRAPKCVLKAPLKQR